MSASSFFLLDPAFCNSTALPVSRGSEMHFQLCYTSIHAKMSDAVTSCSVPSINQARIYEDEAGFGLVAR